MKDFKTISFYKFAQSIGAVEKSDQISNIDINDLLLRSFLFLTKEKILTKSQEKEYNTFKDRYNRYLQYCIDNNLIEKDSFTKVENLNIMTVPDMSKIKIPDISKELKEMDIDLDKLGDIFGKLSTKR